MDSGNAFAQTLVVQYHGEGTFGHRQHLHMTWSFLRRYGAEDAPGQIAGFIRDVAAHEGAPDKYNETITRFWIRAVRCAMDEAGDPGSFEDLLREDPELLDKNLPLGHWSPELLWSAEAKKRWVEPDLVPIPSRWPGG